MLPDILPMNMQSKAFLGSALVANLSYWSSYTEPLFSHSGKNIFLTKTNILTKTFFVKNIMSLMFYGLSVHIKAFGLILVVPLNGRRRPFWRERGATRPFLSSVENTENICTY
jgi:hypothetical protein